MRVSPNPTDAALVQRFLLDRSSAAFELLYDRHSPYLFRVARRMLDGNESAAEDALQEAWIRAISALPRFRGESALRTWLCGITINCCRETWRKKASVSLDEVAETSSVRAPGPLTTLALERALAQLEPPSREVIELFDVLGHTHEEIAEILDVAVGTSKSGLFRARETLRGLLATDGKSVKRKES